MTVAKIVYASSTGNTEGISEILEDTFNEMDVEVERLEADEADDETFEDADICVIATYSTGDGERPFDFEDFYEELTDLDLAGKVFGVVGSGDSKLYPDHSFFAALSFDEAFEKTGATRGHEVVKIENDADDADEEILKEFVKALVDAKA
ncbi:flavodoxin domain-containing protein [Enterococcus sp. HY326]|uniref:flavodoxin domain-containing protein n=1 Tax=Enterococcus sp. HY326 TaxID=2971265 RepID=UPI00223EC98B|nr:flavodoxin domain-containing protein [Enterococcus sp. HY326]